MWDEEPPAPTKQRQRLAALLRQLREDTGATQTEFGALVGMHQAKVSRLEIGKQLPTSADIDAWADAARANQAARDQLADRLAAALTETSAHADDLAGGFAAKQAQLSAAEQTVSVVRSYSLAVPGLLQTAEYARRLIAMQAPLHGGGPDSVAGKEGQHAAHVRRIREDQAHEGQRHEHAGMRVAGSKERLLELRGGLAAAHDAQHEYAAVFDGDDRQQQDRCSPLRIGRQQHRIHGGLPSPLHS